MMDQTFLKICNAIAGESKCLSRKVGVIIVQGDDIIASGYNGPPRGFPHCDRRWETAKDWRNVHDPLAHEPEYRSSREVTEPRCPRQMLGYPSGQGLHLCIAGHAERNAITNAARKGISTMGATMYMNCGIPCKDCLIAIIQAGISEIVVADIGLFYDQASPYLLFNSNLTFRQYSKEAL